MAAQTEIARHHRLGSVNRIINQAHAGGLILKKTDQYNLRANMLF